jgi:sRNA-binding protein
MTDWRTDQARSDLVALARQFPNTFFLHENDRRPLKIGIREEIMQVLEPFKHDPKRLRRVLKLYASCEAFRNHHR